MSGASFPSTSPFRRRAIVGPLLILVATLHIIFGIIGSGQLLIDAAIDGWIGAFTGERATFQWYLMTGLVGIIGGIAINTIERAGRLPWPVSWGLLLTSILGLSMDPASGFILVFLVGLIAVWRSYRDSITPDQPPEEALD
ncbi:DUF6463 family protein [Corynebacterium lubricantis]|uniref:DUF6463 family protein n=1 Tax=Corynebacterium lubricantis TaxID=541095 RepID=UPI00035FAF09|nr:DUF6463 family protein [Corynebacterium lubricantis]